MITSVGLQYAKAIFDLALNKCEEENYLENLNVATKVINKQDVICSLLHPSITKNERKNILNETFKEYFNQEFINFLYVLVDNDRLDCIEDILDSYKSILNDYKKVANAIIYTKYQIDENEINNIKSVLEKHLNKKINLKIVIDETIIGGIVVNVDGKIIDGSIIRQLNNIKNDLKKGW